MREFLKRLFTPQPTAPLGVPPPAPTPPPRPPVRVAPPGRPPATTLADVLRALGGHLPLPAAVSLACRLCELVSGSTAPLGGLNHDDVRVTPEGDVFITGPYPWSADQRQSLRGSLWHMSPEQIQAHPLDTRSDVFNLATVLYEWLAGGRLFGGDSDFAVLEAVRFARLPPRPLVVPEALHEVLRRALAADPEDRFQTPADLRAALFPFAGDFDTRAFAELVRPHLPALPPLPPEPPPRTPLTPGDEGARLVYADWLEEHGKPDEASWLRQESALRSLEGAALEAALLRLRELSTRISTEFMASVARPAIEGCALRFGFKCPLKWEAMQRTGRDELRHCAGCRQDVHFCRTLDEAQQLSRQGTCVALDPSLVRAAGDLDPTPPEGSYLGRLA
ncbi:MAG: TIGR02996 domain-containing protein [Myxococcales bacterium]|nr:TIGR02996 domain-containing protein [Myxococcales bacterium]